MICGFDIRVEPPENFIKMTVCAVNGCHNTSEKHKKDSNITFHLFPSDPIIAARWIKKIRLNRNKDSWMPTKHTRICSLHFEDEQKYITKGGLCKLRRGAVPNKSLPVFSMEELLHSRNLHSDDLQKSQERNQSQQMVNDIKLTRGKFAVKKCVFPRRIVCHQDMELRNTNTDVLIRERQEIIKELIGNHENEVSNKNDITHEKSMKIEVETDSDIATDKIMEIDDIKVEDPLDNVVDPLDNVVDTMDKVEDTMHKVEDTMHKVEDTMDKVEDTMHKVEDTMHKVEDTMDKVEDTLHKVEDKLDNCELCTVCLSMDRDLKYLGEYEGIFRKIVADTLCQIPVGSIQDIIICWECTALLKRANEFEVKFKKACEHFVFSQPYLNSLSNLETVTLRDADIIIETIEVKSEGICDEEVYSEEMFPNDNFNLDIPEIDNNEKVIDSKIEICKKEFENGIKKKKYVKKTKCKFRVIRTCEKAVRKVQLDEDDLNKCMQKERDSEVFNSSKYQCTDCILGFPDRILFEVHIKQCHMNEGVFVCNKCNQRFIDEKMYLEHMNDHTCMYVCEVCLYESYHKEIVLEHLNEHRVIYQCNICSLKYGKRREIYMHYKDWHEKYICAECGATYRLRHSLENHMKRDHSPVVCIECGANFKTKPALYTHRSIKHAKFPRLIVKRPYKPTKVPCPLCDKIYTKKEYMIDHYNYIHLKTEKFTCDICKKRCPSNTALKKHKKRIHDGVKAKKNKMCNVCGNQFHTTKLLEHHLLTHSGERPHSCPLCPSSFAQLVASRAHFKAKHRDVDVAVFDELVKRRREENV